MQRCRFTHAFRRRLLGRILISILLTGPALYFSFCSEEPPTDGSKEIEYGNGIIVGDSIKGETFRSVSIWGTSYYWVASHCKSVLTQGDSYSSVVRVDENIRRNYLSHSIGVWDSELDIKILPTAETQPRPTVYEAAIVCPAFWRLWIYTAICDFTSGFDLDSSVHIVSMLGGSISGRLRAPTLTISMSASYILLTGETENLDVTSRQSTIELQDFAARNVVISCEERSVVKVSCDDTLRVVGRTRSKIFYKGTPKMLIVDLDSTSTLERL